MFSLSSHNTSNIQYITQERYGLGSNKHRNKLNKTIVNALIISALMMTFVYVFIYGLDRTIENQDVMLCKSALKSKNREYLNKCQCYYSSQNIRCLQYY